MGLFKKLIDRLQSGQAGANLEQEWSPQSFNQLTLSQLFDIYQWAWGSSPLEAKARAELRNRQGTLEEWVMIYQRSLTCSWIEDLALRRIRQARATQEEWRQVLFASSEGSLLKKIAKEKMNSTSRS
jgi:hypothetical protein